MWFFVLRNLIKNGKAQLLEILIEGQTGNEVQVLCNDNVRNSITQRDLLISAEFKESIKRLRPHLCVDVKYVELRQYSIDECSRSAVAIAVAQERYRFNYNLPSGDQGDLLS